MKILLVSHGDFAKGMHSTLTNFFGANDVYWANVSLEKGISGLTETIDSYLEEWKDEQVVICSDLKGGSANQNAYKYIKRPNTWLISGMNLALLLQLITSSDINSDTLKSFIESAREDMVLINELQYQASEDDE